MYSRKPKTSNTLVQQPLGLVKFLTKSINEGAYITLIKYFKSKNFLRGTKSRLYTALVPKPGGRVHIAGETQVIITKYNFY
jgi:hypothetical protein